MPTLGLKPFLSHPGSPLAHLGQLGSPRGHGELGDPSPVPTPRWGSRCPIPGAGPSLLKLLPTAAHSLSPDLGLIGCCPRSSKSDHGSHEMKFSGCERLPAASITPARRALPPGGCQRSAFAFPGQTTVVSSLLMELPRDAITPPGAVPCPRAIPAAPSSWQHLRVQLGYDGHVSVPVVSSADGWCYQLAFGRIDFFHFFIFFFPVSHVRAA